MHPRIRSTAVATLLLLAASVMFTGSARAGHVPTCLDQCLFDYTQCFAGSGGDPDLLEFVCRPQLAACRAACPIAPACIHATECVWPVGCTFSQWSNSSVPFFDPNVGPVALRGMILTELPACTAVPASDPFTVNSFFDVFLELSLDGGATWQSHTASGHGQAALTPNVPLSSGAERWFDIVIQQLDISGGTLPAGVLLREYATYPGVMRDLDMGAPGFGFDSFFGVIFEESLNGGVTWGRADQVAPFSLGTDLPVPTRHSTWGAVKAMYR
jgi:hypothetical protein